MPTSPLVRLHSLDNADNKIYKYIYNIRNLVPLTKEEIEDISHMSGEDKMKIIETYNSVIENMEGLFST